MICDVKALLSSSVAAAASSEVAVCVFLNEYKCIPYANTELDDTLILTLTRRPSKPNLSPQLHRQPKFGELVGASARSQLTAGPRSQPRVY